MFNKFKSIISKFETKNNFSLSVKSLEELDYFNSAKKIFSILKNKNKNVKFMLVGGCVRKLLKGEQINDIDIATNLNPEEIKKILNENNIKFLETGILYGTITVVINKFKFEITTLRKDKSTDGRHADVEFISDWEIDSKRRDFTINAIYSDLRGKIYDPLNGTQDLANGKVKFIGDPDKRIKEDYLRILRYLRFYTQYSRYEHSDETIKAIKRNLNGTLKISRERVLDELIKILSLKNFNSLFANEFSCFTLLSIFPQLKYYSRIKFVNKVLKKPSIRLDPILILSILLIDGSDNCEFFLYKYNLPNKVKKRILFIKKNFKKEILNDLFNKRKLSKLLYLNGMEATTDMLVFSIFVKEDISLNLVEKHINFIKNEKIPTFPIEADYLKLQYGFTESKELGTALSQLKEFWINNNFKISKKEIENILKIN